MHLYRAGVLLLIPALAPAQHPDPARDPVARFAESMDDGRAQLSFEDRQGYLRSLLDQLRVPADSQVLVFSKTSFQGDLISPKNPRAVYFNDTVSMGYVPGGEVYEISAVDPVKGVQFYTLSTR